jgi:hypothetical protein
VIPLTNPRAGKRADEGVPAAAGALMPLDWEAVARAFDSANAELRWGADVVIRPERRHVSIRYPRELRNHVARTTIDFHNAVAERIGLKEWMSLWVDLAMKETLETSGPSLKGARRW